LSVTLAMAAYWDIYVGLAHLSGYLSGKPRRIVIECNKNLMCRKIGPSPFDAISGAAPSTG